MKAKIVKQWNLDESQVWLYEETRSAGELYIYKVGPTGHLLGKLINKGDLLPEDWCMHLPHDALKALVDAAKDEYPPSDATVGQLKDAIAVRDRLLTIVEKRFQP
jgi:hypothetical protein